MERQTKICIECGVLEYADLVIDGVCAECYGVVVCQHCTGAEATEVLEREGKASEAVCAECYEKAQETGVYDKPRTE